MVMNAEEMKKLSHSEAIKKFEESELFEAIHKAASDGETHIIQTFATLEDYLEYGNDHQIALRVLGYKTHQVTDLKENFEPCFRRISWDD